jgi:NDP-sugar pyrophosphorylase family protein
MKQCVILVGGLGSRLGSLTEECPKPLLHVNGIPFLEYLIRNAMQHGFSDFLLLAGYLGKKVEEYSSLLRVKYDIKIDVVIEGRPMGTGGALKNAANKLANKFIMMNGDSIFQCNLENLYNTKLLPPFLGYIALRRTPNTSRFGVVELQGEQIIGFLERPVSGGLSLVNCGVYLFDRKIVNHIPSGVSSLERDVFPALANIGELSGSLCGNFFIDIGVPDDYKAAQIIIPKLFKFEF